ncbi:hypothetical protein [Thiolapillus sp.]
MPDLEGKIAGYLQRCRELVELQGGEGCLQVDSITFDILEEKAREVIIAIRFIEVVADFIEVVADGPQSGLGQVDRYRRLRLELNEFGEISSASVC